jgi:hypothetical protein
MSRNKTLAFVFVLALLLSAVVPALAQGEITVVSESTSPKFQTGVTFTLEAKGSASDITTITLFYQMGSQAVTSYAYPTFTPGRSVKAEYLLDTKKSYLPPGVSITYYYVIEDGQAHKLKTEPKSVLYGDSRHTWKALGNDKLSLNWYQGSDAFGQALFNAAKAGLAQLETDAGVTVNRPVSLWIYATYEELRGSLAQGANEWTGGVSFSDMGIILIGIAESNLEWGKRAAVHELSHVVVDQATHNPYGDLPRWLNEGIAMNSEGPMESNYKSALDSAVRNNRLLTLKTLSSNFPADSAQASLAYAESLSVVRFLIDTQGRDKLSALLNVFKDGSTYDGALKKIYGMDTDGLDAAWQASLGVKPQAASPTAPRATPTPPRTTTTPPGPTPTGPSRATPIPPPQDTTVPNTQTFLTLLVVCSAGFCVFVAVCIILLVTWLARRGRH